MTPSSRALTTLSIAITALTAGSIFTFPIFGPALTRDLGLSLTQTNVLWSGAVVGQYLTAAIWGALGDAYGPRLLSGAAGVIFLVGYQLMAYADVVAASSVVRGDGMARGSFIVTLAAFTAIGSGVAASYFSAVTASTRLFTKQPGLAIAGPLTLFSLSSLFLTSVGTRFFSDAATGDLDASRFLAFLGWLLGGTNAFATVAMTTTATTTPAAEATTPAASSRSAYEDDEETPLLRQDDASSRSAPIILAGVPESQSIFAFLSTPAVWSLGLLMVVGVGGAEMTLSSVGNMVVSLLGSQAEGAAAAAAAARPGIGPIALEIRASQVKLLAASNTVARLLGGVLSDAVAPNPAASTTPSRRFPRISRITLLLAATALLAAAFAFAAFGLDSTNGLPAFSIAVGVGYGLLFVLVPAVVVSAFGPAHFGRNWGLLSYMCALGSTSFSLLYAAVSDRVAAGEGEHQRGNGATCLAGPRCFQGAFQVALVGSVAAGVALVPVWRRWRRSL